MKNSKKVLLVLASIVLAGVLSGCNGNNSSSDTPSSNSTSSQVTSSESSSSASSNPTTSAPSSVPTTSAPTSSEAPHTHSYGAWTITTAPTTTATGVATRTCVDSDDTETATVPVLTDTSVWSVKSTTPATCENAGSVTYTSTYGDVTVTLDPINHNYGAWTLETNPTLETAGSAKRVCANDATHVETTSVPALTDTSVWSVKSTTPATCTEQGNVVYTSTYGDVTVTVSATNHAYGEWTITTAPTLEVAGSAEKVCANDQGHKDTATLPVLTDTSVWSVKSTTPATCTEAGSVTYTSTYGDVTVTVPSTGHSYGAWTIVTEPTLENGGTAKKVCANDATHVLEENIPALSNTEVWSVKSTTPATCTEAGSKTYTSVYGDVTVTLPATGHEYGAWALDFEPTLTEPGLASRVCEHDATHFEEVDVPVLTDTSVWTLESETAPTLTTPGSKTYTSTYGTVTIEVPALSNTAVWVVETTPATCDENGLSVYTSTLYGTVEVTIPSTGHQYGEWGYEVEPTESTAGHAVKVCANGEHPIELDVPALSDTSFWTLDTEASSEAGCGVAGTTVYVNAEHNITYVVEKGALAHQGEWTISVVPTDTTPGVITRVCSNCQTPEETEIPSLTTAGAYLVTRVEPTATSPGTVTYTYVTTDNQEVSVTHYLYLITENAGLPFVTIDHRDSKTFVDDGTGRFVSNNTGISSSSAYIDFFFSAPGKLTLDYVISSESGWDKGNVYYQGGSGTSYGNIKKDLSGESSGSLSLTFTGEGVEYNKVYFSYSKDSGGNKGSDTFTVYNLVFETTVKLETKTLTYNTNGGTEIAATTVYKGAGVSLPTAPTKEGAFFAGWYLDEELTQALTNTYVVENDVTLYAKWVDPVTLTFNVNGGTDVSAIEGLEPGTAIEMPSDPTKENAYFGGWYVDVECTTEFDPSTGINENTTIYAKWREPVVLSFNTDGGTTVDPVSTDINVAIDSPEAPTKENHRFDGWYTDVECTTIFDFANGITEDTTVYAKWVESVVVTIYYGSDVVTTATIDKDSNYSVELPTDFTAGKNITIYADAEFTNEYLDGTVISGNTSLYIKVVQLSSYFAPDGVIASLVNGDETNSKVYEWQIDNDGNVTTLTSTNKGVGSSYSTIKIVLAKDSILTFDVWQSSEGKYDYVKVKVKENGSTTWTEKWNSKGNGNEIVTASCMLKLNAGDEIDISYSKDSSGNQLEDKAIITNLRLSDGYPTSSITYVYNDGATPNGTSSIDYGSTLTDAHLPTPENVRGENYQFEGWYVDEAYIIKASTSTLANSEQITLYARWLEKVTVTFVVPEGATTVADVSVWTHTAIDVENPTLAKHIFRGWYLDAEFEFEADMNEGVSEGATLYAKFEQVPVGSSKTEAREVVITEGAYSSSLTTTQEFNYYYLVFTPTTTDYYYFLFNTNAIDKDNVQHTSNNTYSTNYARYNVTDNEGTTILSNTSFDTSPKALRLEQGKTYYIAATLSYNYVAWGDFAVEITQADHDTVNEAIDYTFGEKVVIEGLFKSKAHKLVYSFTTDADTQGDYILKVDGTGWAGTYIYSDAEFTTQVAYVSHTGGNSANGNVVLQANKTYYVVISNNWTASELATCNTTFQICEYEQGYSIDNPLTLTLGENTSVEFTGGYAHYYSITLDETTTLKVELSGGYSSSTKQVYVYNANDLNTALFTFTNKSVDSAYGYVKLEAGNYILKANYASNNTTAYTLNVSVAQAGISNLNPIEITLPSEDGTVDGITSISSNGTYYSFTTGEQLWHFFTASDSTSTVKLIKMDGTTETVVNTGVGTVAAKLDAETTYVLYVSNSETVEATISHATLTEYRDGSSAESAFIFDIENGVADLSLAEKSYTVWYQINVEEAGTYKIYASNNGSIDTKGYLYESNGSTQINYNDDVGTPNMANYGCGHRFDFAFTQELEVGTYFVKITYTINSSNTATSLTLNVNKA